MQVESLITSSRSGHSPARHSLTEGTIGTLLFAATLLALTTMLAGCSISIGGRSQSDSDDSMEAYEHPDDWHVADRGNGYASQIDAAGDLPFSSDQTSILGQIAAREDLCEEDQHHLIRTTLKKVSFSSSQAEVLVILASNPTLTPSAADYMARRVRSMSFSSDREKVLRALLDNNQEVH